MQFTILVVAAFAAAAIATPVPDKECKCDDGKTKSPKTSTEFSTKTSTQSSTKTSSSASATSTLTDGQQQQQKCGNNQHLSCCDSVQKQTLNGIPIQVGINCVTINVLSVVPVTQQCSTQTACCQSGSQTGLVNVGNICPIIL